MASEDVDDVAVDLNGRSTWFLEESRTAARSSAVNQLAVSPLPSASFGSPGSRAPGMSAQRNSGSPGLDMLNCSTMT